MRLSAISIPRGKARDAARLALQSAVAAAASFSILRTAGLPEEFVGILSAVLVVQPTIGNTLQDAWQRFAATLVGCAIGVSCLVLLPTGYGTAAALALSTGAMHLVAAFRPEWRYGVVAAVALSLGSEGDALQTALDRSIAIGVGVVVGALTTLFVWPDRAATRAQRHLSAALEAAAERLDITVRATQGRSTGEAGRQGARFHRNLERAREAAGAVRLSDPETLEAKIEAARHFYNSVLFVNRVARKADGPIPEDRALSERVEAIRCIGCDIARGLAGGDEGLGTRLDEIATQLAAIRDAATARDEPPEKLLLWNALVFGLDEIEDSLRELVELYGRR